MATDWNLQHPPGPMRTVTRSKEKEKEKNAPKKPDSHEASNIY